MFEERSVLTRVKSRELRGQRPVYSWPGGKRIVTHQHDEPLVENTDHHWQCYKYCQVVEFYGFLDFSISHLTPVPVASVYRPA
jgi:hypothetical protein